MDLRKFWWLKAGVSLAGRMMVPTVPYKDLYFLDTAKRFRQALKLPLIYVGGVTSREGMQRVLDEGFVAFQMARTLVRDPDFMNKIRSGEQSCSECGHSNYCIGRMYTLEMRCHTCVNDLPRKLQREVDQLEADVKKSNR
jgi:2,4-dienoyl-CoA reductase-like NADH-dependent reductase (Old Yellow Enzyme family)